MIFPSEAIHRELDARLRAHFDEPSTVSVYSDWLEERGDPRGELMRMQSQPPIAGGPTDGAFIDRHWERWFGVPPSGWNVWPGLTWRSGFVREAALCRASEFPLSRLWALPVMRFLQDLTLSAGAGPLAFAGLGQLPCLQVLRGRLNPGDLAALAGQRLAALESLTLQFSNGVSDADVVALGQVELPALRTLCCGLGAVRASRIAVDVARALTRWPGVATRLELEDEAVLPELIPLLVSPRGGDVTLAMPPALATAWRDRLRGAPSVRLRLLLPNGYGQNEVQTSATSGFESSMVPWPFDPDEISVCGACASQRVRCHYREDRPPPPDDVIGETDIEARCDDCGQFSRYTRLRYTGPIEDDSWREDLGDGYWD